MRLARRAARASGAPRRDGLLGLAATAAPVSQATLRCAACRSWPIEPVRLIRPTSLAGGADGT
jgi:hypothetical protein